MSANLKISHSLVILDWKIINSLYLFQCVCLREGSPIVSESSLLFLCEEFFPFPAVFPAFVPSAFFYVTLFCTRRQAGCPRKNAGGHLANAFELALKRNGLPITVSGQRPHNKS